MDGVQLLLEKGCVPLRQPHRWSVRSLPSSPPKPAASQPAEKEQGNDSPMKSGSRSSETWHVSMVQHSLPAVLCFLTRVFGAMHGCLIPEGFSFHPSAFHHSLSKVIYLPSSYWVMRIHYLLFSKGFEITPPLLHKVHTPPASSRSSNLPEISVFMWDQHAGPNAFPLPSERSEQQCIESLNILITQLC